MINRAELKNFGPIKQLDWQNLGKINLIIGNNGCGKSFLLKALYSAVRTLEDYKRGDNPDSVTNILKSKLYWTFQPEKIGDLVAKQNDAALCFSLLLDGQEFSYSFGKDTVKAINSIENKVVPRKSNSIFLPAKEVLSIHHLILEARQSRKLFGFDDTYFDLAKALTITELDGYLNMFEKKGVNISEHQNPIKGYDSDDFKKSRQLLENLIDGKIEYDQTEKRWYFKKGKQRFSIGVTAEGIKKIVILDTLLGNGQLDEDSIVFIDEPESNLHPKAIVDFLDIIALLAQQDIQFFLASHSYFVIKKLFLIAQEQRLSIPVLSYQNDEWVQSDLKDEMPDNPIINESIRLYEEEVDLAFK
jgi:AAA15 family ATPase/GTPase